MKVRFSLAWKMSVFAALVVTVACAAVWYYAVFRPALRERAERAEQYQQLGLMLGLSGAINTEVLAHKEIHPDLVYVIRARNGVVISEGSVVHGERLAPLDARLAQAFKTDSYKALAEIYQLDADAREGLIVKRVSVKFKTAREETGQEDIKLGFSTREIDRALRDRLISSLLVLVVCLLAATVSACLMARRIASPVRELVAGMNRTGKGNYQTVEVFSRDEVGLLARAFNNMVRGLKERERLKDTLARYVSDDVATRILNERSDLDLKGEMREVTVLFLDIRGFTGVALRLEPHEVMAMLNEYFETVIEVVDKHHGTVNKFIGDAVMAIFGAPFAVDDAPMRAVQAAMEIEQRIASLNIRRKAEQKPVVAMGIGINSGAAIAGNVGSQRRMEYTVIGDDVNLAQRLESMAQEGEILISQATYELVSDRVEARARESMLAKGRTETVWVYEVIGLRVL